MLRAFNWLNVVNKTSLKQSTEPNCFSLQASFTSCFLRKSVFHMFPVTLNRTICVVLKILKDHFLIYFLVLRLQSSVG